MKEEIDQREIRKTKTSELTEDFLLRNEQFQKSKEQKLLQRKQEIDKKNQEKEYQGDFKPKINEYNESRKLEDLINWEKKKQEKIEQEKQSKEIEVQKMANTYIARKVPNTESFQEIQEKIKQNKMLEKKDVGERLYSYSKLYEEKIKQKEREIYGQQQAPQINTNYEVESKVSKYFKNQDNFQEQSEKNFITLNTHLQTGILQYNTKNKSYQKNLKDLEKDYKNTQPTIRISHVVKKRESKSEIKRVSKNLVKNMFDNSFSLNNEQGLEQQLIKATQHFTSKDQLLPFIPINPNIEPDEIEPFSEDEELNQMYINNDIDYEKILDPDLGSFPKQTPTVLIQEGQQDHYNIPERPQKTMTEYYEDTMKKLREDAEVMELRKIKIQEELKKTIQERKQTQKYSNIHKEKIVDVKI